MTQIAAVRELDWRLFAKMVQWQVVGGFWEVRRVYGFWRSGS